MKLLNLMVDSGTKLVMGISAIAVLVVTSPRSCFDMCSSLRSLGARTCCAWPLPIWYSGEPPGVSGKKGT